MVSQKVLPQYQPGDRVRVDKAVTTVPAQPGYVGTVREVIPCYADETIGYNVSVEDDPHTERVWFSSCTS